MCHEWPLRERLHMLTQTSPDNVGGNNAYVSLLFGASVPNILHGMALGQSLDRFEHAYDRVLLVTDDVPAWALHFLRLNWLVRRVQEIDMHRIDPAFFEQYSERHRQNEARMFLKLHLFDSSLLPYDKVLFLDIDMVILDSIDEVFNLPPFSAVPCYGIYDSHGKQILNGDHHTEGREMEPGTTFNGGVMLIAPNRKVHGMLMDDIYMREPWHKSSSHPSSWFLKEVFVWHAMGPDMNFSVRLTKGQAMSPAFFEFTIHQIRGLHFMGDGRPHLWFKHGTIEPFKRDWWKKSKLPKDFTKSQYEQMELRGRAALAAYATFASQAIVKCAAATGWKPIGCLSGAEEFKTAMLHCIAVIKTQMCIQSSRYHAVKLLGALFALLFEWITSLMRGSQLALRRFSSRSAFLDCFASVANRICTVLIRK